MNMQTENDTNGGKKGYVYILEVKDIDLPVCKIGRTTLTPAERCSQINHSSTGDFLWAVAHYVAVDDCHALEALVHRKLAPLRQKRREFFNIDADKAYAALLSILENQQEIRVLAADEMPERRPAEPRQQTSLTKKKRRFACDNPDDIAVIHAFCSILNIKGRPFGAANKPRFGVSDGESVQWSLAIDKKTGETSLSVNLEGSGKTGQWLIAPFILARPDIETLRARLSAPGNIFVRFMRDAWRYSVRENIVEKFLGGKRFALSELDRALWDTILDEALACLDEEKEYRGRRKQQEVTLESNGKTVKRDVSPHLNIETRIDRNGDIEKELRQAFQTLRPVYEWVHEACGVSVPEKRTESVSM